MRFVSCLFFCTLNFAALSQDAPRDLAKDLLSADRKSILAALRQKLEKPLKLQPKLVVSKLTLKNGFAFFAGNVKNSTGGTIDFTKTAYRDAVREGAFDGDATTALLKKRGGTWRVLAYAVGATDVPFGCWWKEFNAPKDIFDYAEKECDWVK